MCICVFAPQHSISLIYGHEAVWLTSRTGLFVVVADILLQNTSSSPIETLCCLVPQRIYPRDGFQDAPPRVEDITTDLANPNSPYGLALANPYTLFESGGRTILRCTLPDPTDTTHDIHYDGVFLGRNTIEAFPRDCSPEQRVLMNARMFGAVCIRLGRAVAPEEARWIRLRITPLTGPREHRGRWNFIQSCLHNDIFYSYSVSGPTKVRYDVEKDLANLRRVAMDEKMKPDAGQILTDLQTLSNTLVTEATRHPKTVVEIKDWRVRFYQGCMEPFAGIQTEGAARAAGAQPNLDARGASSPYYEWCTGSLQVDSPPTGTEHGYFTVRFNTRYIPWLFRLAPVLGVAAFVIAIVRLILDLRRKFG